LDVWIETDELSLEWQGVRVEILEALQDMPISLIVSLHRLDHGIANISVEIQLWIRVQELYPDPKVPRILKKVKIALDHRSKSNMRKIVDGKAHKRAWSETLRLPPIDPATTADNK
jgi:hypothetical protein